jgi:hypothetical protein
MMIMCIILWGMHEIDFLLLFVVDILPDMKLVSYF